MQQYQKDYLKSRNKTISDIIMCEYPWCKYRAVDIHHIRCSYRWARRHNEDWSDLIALCRHHHDEVHKKNNKKTRAMLMEIVKEVLENKLERDEKIN